MTPVSDRRHYNARYTLLESDMSQHTTQKSYHINVNYIANEKLHILEHNASAFQG